MLGCTKDESNSVLPDRAAGTSHEPCAWAHRPAREESPFAGGIGESAAANYAARLCAIRVSTDGLVKTRERHGCERSGKGGLYPKIALKKEFRQDLRDKTH